MATARENKKRAATHGPAFQRKAIHAAVLASLGLLLWAPGLASSQEAGNGGGKGTEQQLETITVRGQKLSEADKDRIKLQAVTGNTAVVDQKEIERGRSASLEDQLVLQPGVYAQTTGGNGAAKVSIRGSGLNTFYGGYALGIKYLYDGLPVTGPGGTQEDLLTANGTDHTEILYGANAFAYTALSLGGAINFVTNTGRTAPGNYVRTEAGSFGYAKTQVSTGGVAGENDSTDYYVSVLQNKREGFQQYTQNSGEDLIANIGHVFSPKLDARFILHYRDEKLLVSSQLTKAQIDADPTQSVTQSGRYKAGTTLAIGKVNYTFDDNAKLEAGFAYNNYPLYNGWIYSATPQNWQSTDRSVTLRYLRTGDTLFGKQSDTTVSFSNTQLSGDVTAYNAGNGSVRQHTNYTGSRDTVLAIGNELQLDEKWGLSSGVSFIDMDRNVTIDYTTLANPTAYPLAQHYQDSKVAPRVGLRYQLDPEVQFFGNVSRSIDPPVTWYYASTGVGYARPISAQEATTLEFGVRSTGDIFESSLTLYRSWIDKELLSVVVVPATTTAAAIIANYNATATIHQGIEAGLNAKLWKKEGDAVVLRQAFTLNDFKYVNDPVFGSNLLPSLPKYAYQAELQYTAGNGFYAGLNLQASSSYYVDYANTLEAPGYGILGLKTGYEAPGKKWSVFLDARNLGNKHYVAASTTAYNLNGVDSAYFRPGDGFGLTVGASLRF